MYNNKPPVEYFELTRVRCRDCEYFRRDEIGDGQGIGDCFNARVHANPPLHWPNVMRICTGFMTRL